jgi:hypothetical protein
MNKTAILALLTILTLLVACAPKVAMPASPEAAPAASEEPPAPEAAPAEPAAPVENTSAAPAAVPSNDPVIVGKLTAEQRAELSNQLATVAATADMLGHSIADLQVYAQKSNQALVAPTNQFKKLFDDGAVMLATIQGQAAAGDEQVDENTVKFREQLDGMVVMVSNIENVAALSTDETLLTMLDSITEDVGQMEQDYKFGYIAALEQFTNADLESNPYYSPIEASTDTALMQGYNVQKSDLDAVEAAAQASMFAPEGQQPTQ